MENLNNTQPIEQSTMELSSHAIGFLKTTAKWAKFIAILGFIGIGLLVFMAFFMGTFFEKMLELSNGGVGMPPQQSPINMSFFFIVTYLIAAAIYFYPVYSLFKFSTNTQKAFKTNDSLTLTRAFENLKNLYLFMGVIALMFIILYAAVFLFILLFAFFAS